MSQVMSENIVSMVETLMVNVANPFMSKVTQEEVQLCWDICKEESNDRFTPEVQAAAQRLIDEEGVTCDDISDFSKALFMIDCVTSPPIRKQCRSGMRACDTFVQNGKVIDILPNYTTNTHVKHEKIEKEYVVLVVLGRAVLRLHGHVLDEGIAPLDSEGRELSNTRRAELFSTMGEVYLGLPGSSESEVSQ
ncbi:unnamed protein product [Ectocarpus sp. 8 AP-2014]